MNNFSAIPDELRVMPHWVVVDADSKVPKDPRTGRPASSSDPSTWGSFEEALRAVETGDAGNIGYVFDDNGYVGIDLDVGWDEDGFLTAFAAGIILDCDSYTERSRSGRGFHIILRGRLPFKGRNNRAGLEIYQDSRYFITTGDVFQGYGTIRGNQDAINRIVGAYFASDVRDGGDGGFNRIYTPQWQLPQDGRIKLRPVYPRIPAGCRNICLTSLAGILHSQGYDTQHIYDELTYANLTACDPVLDTYEIESIVRSVARYKR